MPFNLPKKFTGRYIDLLGEIRYFNKGIQCKEEEVEVVGADIPLQEQWIHQNPEAKKALEEGLESASQDPLVDRGSFAKYASEEE